ncbi:MAG TPA: glycosyltransferase family 4 protein [Candidatus Acidoferrales bacterium]|nr:glycosyltransferase family 4 protein [Candidatus Acidoferrales bacterium]
MTADTLGGVWTYAMELIHALHAKGVDVSLATMGRPLSREQRADIRRSGCDSVFESCFKLEWMDEPWSDIESCGEWLMRIERDVSPDVVHLNQYCFGSLPWRAPVLTMCHSCVLSWWLAVRGESAPQKPWARYRQAVCRGLGGADVVVAPTQAMLCSMKRLYGLRAPSVVIPNGRSSWRLHAAKKQAFVFAAGRLWDEAKNIAALDRIEPNLAWPVYVAGEAECVGRGQEASGFQPRNCALLGQLSAAEVAEWMARATIYCLPARYEPFGLSVLEAALSGCALVLGDIPSLRENWDDAASFVPPGDDDALCAALNNLIEHESARMSLARRSLRRASDFGVDRMVSAYLSAYQSLMSRHDVASGGWEASACAS